MVPCPRLLTLDFDEGIQAQGAGIRPDHYDPLRVICPDPGHESLHLLPNLLREGLGSLQTGDVFDGVFKIDPTVAVVEAEFDRHCAEGAVFGVVRPPPVVVGRR